MCTSETGPCGNDRHGEGEIPKQTSDSSSDEKPVCTLLFLFLVVRRILNRVLNCSVRATSQARTIRASRRLTVQAVETGNDDDLSERPLTSAVQIPSSNLGVYTPNARNPQGHSPVSSRLARAPSGPRSLRAHDLSLDPLY